MFTDLLKYRLWYDGVKSYTYDQLCDSSFSEPDLLKSCYISGHDSSFEEFYQMVDIRYPIKDSLLPFDNSISSSIDTSFNLYDFIVDKFITLNLYEQKIHVCKKFERLETEWCKVQILKKEKLLYIVIHVVNTLNVNKIPWCSRGSCSASYILYLLGVHHIDSFKYDIDDAEFFKF